jgi:hypothetical protein
MFSYAFSVHSLMSLMNDLIGLGGYVVLPSGRRGVVVEPVGNRVIPCNALGRCLEPLAHGVVQIHSSAFFWESEKCGGMTGLTSVGTTAPRDGAATPG